ncbi:hypothetical protein I305_02120 [Cryptococcus gattii E566]|uniref:Uncharacterized protein n=2 Tax=Cryptococcus gattii TaxID=37769 RepID=E6RDA5_CRYGW|nr:Hypothetical Protein CGB_K1100C [Cryptococcus gattii WM276]ADV24878.1 Hypothetical Protein CGB_K1100C [Cryptococcus gattii WM276]KIR79281.1 hypothetical protein I306_03700 [Cryptococcus gattii EJB2]KIY35214.1 hypothetical protein I305_02120 [Cryptococcus gattii E566]KJE05678.1 hypothetical protein I311_00403 [Cryptococcus gattii NT-10]
MIIGHKGQWYVTPSSNPTPPSPIIAKEGGLYRLFGLHGELSCQD